MKLQDFLAQADEWMLIPRQEDGKVTSYVLEADGIKAVFDVFGHVSIENQRIERE